MAGLVRDASQSTKWPVNASARLRRGDAGERCSRGPPHTRCEGITGPPGQAAPCETLKKALLLWEVLDMRIVTVCWVGLMLVAPRAMAQVPDEVPALLKAESVKVDPKDDAMQKLLKEQI